MSNINLLPRRVSLSGVCVLAKDPSVEFRTLMSRRILLETFSKDPCELAG